MKISPLFIFCQFFEFASYFPLEIQEWLPNISQCIKLALNFLNYICRYRRWKVAKSICDYVEFAKFFRPSTVKWNSLHEIKAFSICERKIIQIRFVSFTPSYSHIRNLYRTVKEDWSVYNPLLFFLLSIIN